MSLPTDLNLPSNSGAGLLAAQGVSVFIHEKITVRRMIGGWLQAPILRYRATEQPTGPRGNVTHAPGMRKNLYFMVV